LAASVSARLPMKDALAAAFGAEALPVAVFKTRLRRFR
jgi:hypothetical protein